MIFRADPYKYTMAILFTSIYTHSCCSLTHTRTYTHTRARKIITRVLFLRPIFTGYIFLIHFISLFCYRFFNYNIVFYILLNISFICIYFNITFVIPFLPDFNFFLMARHGPKVLVGGGQI